MIRKQVKTQYSSDEMIKLEEYTKPKLKPCPFCGDRNIKFHIGSPKRGQYSYYIRCQNCPAKLDSYLDGRLLQGLCDKMIAEWNRRV